MQSSPPPRRPGRQRQAGFTIVEVLMATFVMAFAITSSILVMQHGFRYLDTARKTTLAAQIMQSEMERIRMLSWGRISALPPSEPIDFDDIFPANTTAEQAVLARIRQTFTATRTVTSLAEYNNEIRQIDVRITWTGLDGVNHTRTSSTQYCQDGLYAYYYTGL
ncbi:MAG: prepilin-type N-terminal cleavage/methylation domain-containing protein [Verrucomicrobiota bacterium]